jgi:hypothetical protein
MIWYIIGAVVILGIILFLVLGKKKTKIEEDGEAGQIDGSEMEGTTIEPTIEDETDDMKSEEGSEMPAEDLSMPTEEGSSEEEKTV